MPINYLNSRKSKKNRKDDLKVDKDYKTPVIWNDCSSFKVTFYFSFINIVEAPYKAKERSVDQGGRGHWAVYYISPQTLIVYFLIC